MPKYRVTYTKSSTVFDRYSMVVEAPDEEAAKQRVKDGFEGKVDLTDDEYATEHHEKEIDSDGSQFEGLCEEPYHAPVEVDENGDY